MITKKCLTRICSFNNKLYFYFLFLSVLIISKPLIAQYSPAEVYKNSSSAVVLLLSSHPQNKYRSKGTGSIVGLGRILTNAHVVLDDRGEPFSQIRIYLHRDNANDDSIRKLNKGMNARIQRIDLNLDLALVEVKGLEHIEPILLGDSSNIAIGDPVLAIGHPENGGLWSLTSGRIGAKIEIKAVLEGVMFSNRGQSQPWKFWWTTPKLLGRADCVNTRSHEKPQTGLPSQALISRFSLLQENGSRMVVLSSQQKIKENSDLDIQLIGTERNEKKINPGIIPKSYSDGLLTRPRPFRDRDLTDPFFEKQNEKFESFVEKQNNEFEKILNSQDAQFDSFFKTSK